MYKEMYDMYSGYSGSASGTSDMYYSDEDPAMPNSQPCANDMITSEFRYMVDSLPNELDCLPHACDASGFAALMDGMSGKDVSAESDQAMEVP